MLIERRERWRGYDSWIQTEARIESSDVTENDIKNQYGQTIVKDYSAGDRITWVDAEGQKHESKFSVDEESPLYQYVDGETLTIRYDPNRPNRFYQRDLMRSQIKIAIWSTVIALGSIAGIAAFLWFDLTRKN